MHCSILLRPITEVFTNSENDIANIKVLSGLNSSLIEDNGFFYLKVSFHFLWFVYTV
jgi:hypothetical protein